MTDTPTTETLTADPHRLWRFEIDGIPFELRPGRITPAQAGALRTQSHGAWRVPTLMEAVIEGAGPEELAGLVFLAGRQAAASAEPGDPPPLTYDAVCELIGDATEAKLDFNAVEDPDSPEA